MDRRPPPDDGGSPARMIATMVGIVGILLLGSLFWSALGALVSALGEASQSLPIGRPPPTLSVPVVVVTATPVATATAVVLPTIVPTAEAVATADATTLPTELPVPPTAQPTPQLSGRAPWVLLPQPAPGSHVSPGALVLEARGRGDLPITDIRLELDGAPLPVTVEQRSESTWRGSAQVRVSTGQHSVRAIVIDQSGHSGAYRWTFDAGP